MVENADLSDEFLVYASEDIIVRKKFSKPSRKERFEKICKTAEKHAKGMGIKEGCVDRLVHEYKNERQNTKIE